MGVAAPPDIAKSWHLLPKDFRKLSAQKRERAVIGPQPGGYYIFAIGSNRDLEDVISSFLLTEADKHLDQADVKSAPPVKNEKKKN